MKFLTALLALGLTALVAAQSNAIDEAVDQPTQEYLPPAEEADSAKLLADGYRYKTVRKLKYFARHRRDVSKEYLAPLASEPQQEYLPPVEENADSTLADDGYRYSTVRKLKFRARHRREVKQEYLPPVNEPLQEYLPPQEEEEKADSTLADDGYRYQTVRKLKLRSRHRRDVSEIEEPANEYLPPADLKEEPEQETAVDKDGYRYKTVRRLKYRRQRRETAAPAADYLPPSEETVAEVVEDSATDAKSADLSQDGYRYKTVRSIRYRHRQ